MPKFMFLQYVDESRAPRPGSPELEREVALYGDLFNEVQAAGVLRGGDPVQASAATFTVQVDGSDSPTASDGPLHRGARALNGYWVLECRDRDEAIAWAARIPAARDGGSVEVHPILAM